MRRIEEITEAVKKYSPGMDISMISRAYVFSARVHKDQLRSSGEPYLSHPLEVAYTLTKLRMDPVAITVGLLHDTLEDTYATEQEIEDLFGKEVLSLVEGLTKISQIQFASREEKESENFRKIILAMTKDIRVILVKLADRVHNIRTLEHVSRERQMRIAKETLDIYGPIANRLGIGWLKRDLEEYSFKFLLPDEYHTIEEKVANSWEERCHYVNNFTEIIEKELTKSEYHFTIKGRPKHYYSIYKKMKLQGISFEEVYDAIGIRIITDDIKNCYAILGVIHSLWKPIPGKIKDYIAMPKGNMYQSLHTTILGPLGRRVELQIRTEEMHRTCEGGIASHWKYKEGVGTEKDEEKFLWLRQLLEWHQELKDPREFLETVKVDLFPDEVYVFTPEGDVKRLPRGATPIDFAYSIHTDIGNHCVGAKINSRMVPLRYTLRDGESVEILTSSTQVPHRDWLALVKSSKAKAHIRAWLKLEQRKQSEFLGRELLQRELEKYKMKSPAVIKSKEFKQVLKDLGFGSIEKLMEAIGFGKLSLASVVTKIVPPELLEIKKEDAQKTKSHEKLKKKTPSEPNITVKGLNDILIRFSRCCNPIPGDNIVGFITRGRGVSIHDKECPNVDLSIDKDRMVSVDWDLGDKTFRKVDIIVNSENKVGLLASISNAIAACDANIAQANITTPEKGPAHINFSIDVVNLEHLKQVLKKIRAVQGVLSVHREKHKEEKSENSGDSQMKLKAVK